MPQSQIEQESNCCLFFTLYIFIKFPAFKKPTTSDVKPQAHLQGSDFSLQGSFADSISFNLLENELKVLHVQPARRRFESERLFGFHCAISGRELIFSPRSNICAEPICQARKALTGGDGKRRWRGVVWFQVKEWIIKSLGFLEEGGGKQRKLKSWLGYCGERRVWSLGSCRDQTGQRWSFYSLKETFALSVTSGFFGLRLYLESGITNCLLHPVASDWVKFTARRNLS